MGQPKHLLPFGDVTVLERIVEVIQSVTPNVVIVTSTHQELPPIPPGVRVVYDELEFEGPLCGLQYGLRALHTTEAVYLTGCDCPLLRSEFVERMFQLLGDNDLVVPIEDRFVHPLAGVYRTSLLPTVEGLIAQGCRRPRQLIDASHSRRIPVTTLRDVDPQLASLRNMNSPEDYHALLQAAGLANQDQFPK